MSARREDDDHGMTKDISVVVDGEDIHDNYQISRDKLRRQCRKPQWHVNTRRINPLVFPCSAFTMDRRDVSNISYTVCYTNRLSLVVIFSLLPVYRPVYAVSTGLSKTIFVPFGRQSTYKAMWNDFSFFLLTITHSTNQKTDLKYTLYFVSNYLVR